jgi:hypothetical protein
VSVADAGRRFAGRVQAARQRRATTPPVLRVAEQGRPATVYYLCPSHDRPSGGIRTIYRHVDTLNAAGMAATVVHATDGFSCTWFEHRTRVTGPRSVTLSPRDVLVVPEWYGPGLTALPAGPRIVIFNQNAYRTFAGIDDSTGPGAPYRSIPGLAGILVVSEDNAQYLRFAFPELPVTQVRNVIDSGLFHPPHRPAGRRLSLMPRKRPDDARQVLRLLAAHGSLDGWEVVTIDNRSEVETASLLRSSAVFLSFSGQEGFGLPPAEAMACGCYVVGYPGFGGREYFNPAFSSPIEEGDVLAFAKAATVILKEEPTAIAARAQGASAHVLGRYNLDGQRADLLSFFTPLLEACDQSGSERA